MSAMGFPGSPTNGDTYEKWVYDAASSSWLIDEAAITLSGSTTDDLAEGSTNLYFTAARLQGELPDEDNMASDDATKAPTQQSTKAYVDATVASGGLITTSGLTAATLVTEADTIASNDNDTTIPTSAAVKDYADTAASGILIDEDAFTSDDATKAPTQQSTKAYVDATVASGGLITTSGLTAATLVTEAEGIASNDNDTTIPTSAAVRDYIDGGFIDDIVAGNGLTGDSTSGTASLAVGAGSGITVNANDVAVNADQRGVITQFGQDTNDYISVGTTNISFVLDGNVDARLFNTGEFHADGDVVAFSTSISDERFKDDVTTITSATEICKNLRGVEYTWNSTGRKGTRDLGFIAQEVEEVLPNIVHSKTLAVGEWADNPVDAKTVDYEKLTAVLVEAVKELSARIDELESK